eukprot:4607587-Amphidinium_carterae.1
MILQVVKALPWRGKSLKGEVKSNHRLIAASSKSLWNEGRRDDHRLDLTASFHAARPLCKTL